MYIRPARTYIYSPPHRFAILSKMRRGTSQCAHSAFASDEKAKRLSERACSLSRPIADIATLVNAQTGEATYTSAKDAEQQGRKQNSAKDGYSA